MIVCICNNVSDHKIRQAVASGTTSMSELRRDLNVATCCGKCNACAHKVLRESLSAITVCPTPAFQQIAMA